ncbi:hypothetical protein [Kitasatospora sp. MBT66]|uniref:hypothetical protein n=1 Tax=Kitasatospora sp. MBT66 TaxID=1444769 RepID=UPI0005BE87B1|nr:hypothetical protein [Kitasatospora sp. MBT66]
MSGDMPLSFVFASCPPAQVEPLLAALDDQEYSLPCSEHFRSPAVRCLPLGSDGTDAELDPGEIHDLYETLRRAAPQASFAVIGGASESGPGVLRMNHPRLGDFRTAVPSEDHPVSPLFSASQVLAILARDAHRPDAALRLHLALGRPWSRQFVNIGSGCLKAPSPRRTSPQQ